DIGIREPVEFFVAEDGTHTGKIIAETVAQPVPVLFVVDFQPLEAREPAVRSDDRFREFRGRTAINPRLLHPVVPGQGAHDEARDDLLRLAQAGMPASFCRRVRQFKPRHVFSPATLTQLRGTSSPSTPRDALPRSSEYGHPIQEAWTSARTA